MESLVAKALYGVVLAIGTLYFLTANRKADWHTVAFFSAGLYFMPGLLGETHVPGEFLEVSALCYIVMTLVFTFIIVSAWLLDAVSARQSKRWRPPVPSSVAGRKGYLVPESATLLQFVGLAYAVSVSGAALLHTDKHSMAATFTSGHLLWLMGAPTAFIVCVFYRRWGLTLLNLLSVLFVLYIGSRNQLAIAVIGAVTVLIGRRGVAPIIRHRKSCLAVVAFVCFVFLYKQCYIAVKAGDFESAVSRIEQRWWQAFVESEPVGIQHILNVVIAENYSCDPISSLGNAVLGNLGLLSRQGRVAFGDVATHHLFGDMGYGMASNIWAEMYAYGGLCAVAVFLLFFVSVIRYFSEERLPEPLYLFGACFLPWWSFYIHRNDMYRMLSFAKQLVVVFVAIYLVVWVSRCLAALYVRRGREVRPVGRVRMVQR